MSLERRMRKRLSDSAAHMSAERKEKKKEVDALAVIAIIPAHNLSNAVITLHPQRKITIKLSLSKLFLTVSYFYRYFCFSSAYPHLSNFIFALLCIGIHFL